MSTPAQPAPASPTPAYIRVRPAWWVPFHAFAVLAARLVFPLALLAVAGWLSALVIQNGASWWFMPVIIALVCICGAAAPRDPDAAA